MRLLPVQHKTGEVGRIKLLDAQARLAIEIVAQSKPQFPRGIAQRQFVKGFMLDRVIAEIFKSRHVGEAVDQFGITKFPFVIQAKVETGALHVIGRDIFVAFIAKRYTRATREGALGFLDKIITHTGAGHVVEIDILHPVKSEFIAHIPRLAAGKIVLVIRAGLSLIGRFNAIGILPVITGIKLQSVHWSFQCSASAERRAELALVAALAVGIDRHFVGPMPFQSCRFLA